MRYYLNVLLLFLGVLLVSCCYFYIYGDYQTKQSKAFIINLFDKYDAYFDEIDDLVGYVEPEPKYYGEFEYIFDKTIVELP